MKPRLPLGFLQPFSEVIWPFCVVVPFVLDEAVELSATAEPTEPFCLLLVGHCGEGGVLVYWPDLTGFAVKAPQVRAAEYEPSGPESCLQDSRPS